MNTKLIVAIVAILFGYLNPFQDEGLRGIGAVVTLVRECGSPNPWCTASGLVGKLGKFSVLVAADPWTEDSTAIADTHAPGADSLDGKVAVVTGVSPGGLGEDTARILLQHGARVIFAVRNVDKGEKVRASLVAEGVSGTAEVMKLDLSDLESVRAFAKDFLSLGAPLHLLIHNAGIMMPPEAQGAQGHELSFSVNHLGHFHLTQLLEEKLLATGTQAEPARVVYLSSEAAQLWFGPQAGSMAQLVPPSLPYHPFHMYALTKALNVLTAKQQQRRWGPEATAIAVAVHPGIIRTQLLTHRSTGKYAIEGAFYGWPFVYGQKTVAQGASTTIYAALAPQVVSQARAGTYFFANNQASEVWFPEQFTDAVAEETWGRSAKLTAV